MIEAKDERDVLERVGPQDFRDPKLGCLLGRLGEMHAAGIPIDLPILRDELRHAGELEKIGGPVTLAELFDSEATGALATYYASRVRRYALEHRRSKLYDRAKDDPDPKIREEIAKVCGLIDGLEGEHQRRRVPIDLQALGFTGASLLALRDRPEAVSPLPDLLDPEPALHVLNGKPKTGKSTFALALARAWSLGVRAWLGAPDLPGSRVLVISREQTATRIDGTLRRLQVYADTGAHDAWTDRITIIARDRALPPDGRALLTLDPEKIDAIQAALLAAREAGDPYGLVVLDSLSRLKPPEIEERDNDGLSGWLDALAGLATSCGVYVLVIHHVGHTTDPSRADARSAGRGASAIAAVAQVVMLLERVPGAPNQRRLEIDGNAVLPGERTFEVASENADPGLIHYFRPCDPLAAHDPADLIGADPITTTELAWRVADKRPENGERPPGAAYKLAKDLRSRWERAGLIEVVTLPGDRGAKRIRLVPQEGGFHA